MPTFTNKATLSYNGKTTDSNTVTGNYIETLAVTKTAVNQTYADGSTVTYAVSLINSGITPFSGLTLTDDLGAYPFSVSETLYPLTYADGSLLYYVNGVVQAAPTVEATQPLTVSGINVPAGGSALLIYQATVNEFAPLAQASTIENTVTVTGGGITEPLTATETVSSLDEPDLSITKALCPSQVVENGAITYTFLIQNDGNTPAVATDNAIVTDTFNPILDITSVTLDGVPLTEGVGYTYDETTGEFATTAGTITVPAATYTQQPDGSYEITPGFATLVVNGTI
jgi:uncharacterized repeat protein (TIGR01451 family)